jgi:hypothetical protein
MLKDVRFARLLFPAILVGCSSSRSIPPPPPVERVTITAAEAWPDRGIEPPPLSLTELAQACALFETCIWGPGLVSTASDDWANGYYACTASQLSRSDVLPTFEDTEERAIPGSPGIGARWSWWARSAIAASGDCATVVGLDTGWVPDEQCEEDGCWFTNTPLPTTSCDGDVATVRYPSTPPGNFVRDCSHSFAHCDPSSPSGCTDRRPVACESWLADRCDGDVKLGCDGTGKVSFHDCARVRARCVETSDGAACQRPPAYRCKLGDVTCTDDRTLHACTQGEFVDVDCTALGFTRCVDAHCSK